MDFNNAFGIEYRVVSEIEHNGTPARVVSGTRTYDAEAAELWDALTNAERIPRWFLPITGELQMGGRYQLKGNAGGEITRCEPPKALDVTWEYAGNVSWVNVRLESDGQRTQLTLEHISPKDEASESHWDQYGPSGTGVGWDLSFLGLEVYLASGAETIIKEEFDAWNTSEAGLTFMRNCAQAWGEAHVESGESSEIALAMAETTAKAYCGEE